MSSYFNLRDDVATTRHTCDGCQRKIRAGQPILRAQRLSGYSLFVHLFCEQCATRVRAAVAAARAGRTTA